MNNFDYLNKDVSILKGIGIKTSSILKKKKINKISDILWDFLELQLITLQTAKLMNYKLEKNILLI